MIRQLNMTDTGRGEFESSDSRAAVEVVWIHGQQVLEAVALDATGFASTVRHEVT